MFKQITTVFALMISAFTLSQVGIDTPAPKATLDVVGKADDTAVMDGIIAPRIEGAKLRAKTYTAEQTGALVYVTLADTAPAGQTVDVTAAGYYYFNGLKWVIAGAGDMVNIYNADGTLTNERTMTMNSNILRFSGTDGTMKIDNDGESEFYINAINSTDARVRLTSGTSDLQIRNIANGSIDFSGRPGGTNSMNIGTPSDASPLSTLEFYTVGSTRMTIDGIGNVGINTNGPTEKLDVNGITRLRSLPLNGSDNAIFTMPDGNSASATQNQTFTATRTLVADANGVLGYVTGLPEAPVNIYNANGNLLDNRIVNQNNKTLTFSNSSAGQSTILGGVDNNGAGLVQRASSGGRASITLQGAGSSSALWIYTDANSAAQMFAGNGSTSLNIGTHISLTSAPLRFFTSSGANALGTEKMRITGTGNIGINTNTPSTVARLHIVKTSADLTPAIIEGCNVYADNAAAATAGVPVGGLYRKADGTLMVRF